MEDLYTYQMEDIASVIGARQNGFPSYLAHEQGLGKSRVALTVAMAIGAKRLLICCPASGRYVWEQQTKLWWPGHPPIHHIRSANDIKYLAGDGVFIVTYGLLSNSATWIPQKAIRAAGVERPYDMTVADEAHALKNPGANRTKAVLREILPVAGFFLPMSGTPAPNHAGELFTILKAVHPEFKGMNQFQYEDRYCKVVNKYFGKARPIRVIEGSKNLDDLRKKMGPGYMIRRWKKDVMKDLPPMRFDTVPVEPSAAVDLSAFSGMLDGLSDDDVLNALLRGDQHIMRLRALLGSAKVGAAIEYLQEFLEDNPTRKIVVWAHHHAVLDALAKGLLGYGVASYDGRTSESQRQLAVERFVHGANYRVFVGQIQAAGTGLTLVGPKYRSSDAFFVETSFSIGDNSQAAQRIHRIGQSEPVIIRYFTAYGTLDERIQSILARKAQDFETLFA